MKSLRHVAAVMVVVAVLLVASSGATAVASPRDQPTNTTPLVRVFVGETLDVSAVQLTGGGTVGTSSVTLIGVAGDADGTTRTLDDPTDADFGGFETGTYRVSSDTDDNPEFVVAEPRVISVVVRNQNGANVTNGWEPTGAELRVTAQYNFAEADRLDLTVESPDGLDVTESVASSDRITTNEGSVRLDLSDESAGVFRITVEGSDLDDARRTVTVRTGPRRTATPLPPAPTETPGPTPTETPPVTTTETPTETATVTTIETPSPTATPGMPTAVPTGTPTATTPTTSTSTPGFGPVVLIAGVLALIVYVLRRP